jgi:hypothetical protein
MSTIHFCLLCHTEGSANDFEVGLPAMLGRVDVLKYSGIRSRLL